MTFGENLKSIRQLCHLTQNKLASMAGLSATAITKYEKGQRLPSAENLSKIASALNLSGDTLLNGTVQDCKLELMQNENTKCEVKFKNTTMLYPNDAANALIFGLLEHSGFKVINKFIDPNNIDKSYLELYIEKENRTIRISYSDFIHFRNQEVPNMVYFFLWKYKIGELPNEFTNELSVDVKSKIEEWSNELPVKGTAANDNPPRQSH